MEIKFVPLGHGLCCKIIDTDRGSAIRTYAIRVASDLYGEIEFVCKTNAACQVDCINSTYRMER